MRVRLELFETANRRVQNRTLLAFIFGGIGLVIFGFILFVGILLIIMPGEPGDGLWPRRTGLFIGIFFGLIPGGLSGLLIAWAIRARSRFRRLGELAVHARQAPALTSAGLAHALQISMLDAERLIVEASSLGLLDHTAPTPALHGPPPLALAPTVAGPGASSSPDLATAAPHPHPPPAPVHPPAPAPAPPPPSGPVGPGSVLGSYQIEGRLGQGGMGAVFTARHVRTGRRYALKTILAGASADEATIRRFEREATAASAIGHPGIVQVHDFDRTGGVFFLVMDLLEGETLEARITRTGTIGWTESRRIGIELCDALAAAHDHALVHRDIKPSNVFLTRQGKAVLVDFGLVKSTDASAGLTSTGAVIGTPMYMSPEQARGEPLDLRSDIYSLAAVLFEMTVGAPPFRDRTLASIYARILGEPAPRASSISREPLPAALDDVLGRALAKDRAARYENARAFASALHGIDEADVPPRTERIAAPPPPSPRLPS